MPSKCMVNALILIYDISSAFLGPKIAMNVILDPKMCEILPIRSYQFSFTYKKNMVTVN